MVMIRKAAEEEEDYCCDNADVDTTYESMAFLHTQTYLVVDVIYYTFSPFLLFCIL